MDRAGNLLKYPEGRARIDYSMLATYVPIAPHDSLERTFDLCWSEYAERWTRATSSELMLPAFPVGKFRLTITYEL